MQTCTNCGTPYDGYACPRCGTLSGQNQSAAHPTYYQGNQPAPVQNRVCLGCGVQIPSNFNNCPHCGRPVDRAPASSQPQYAAPAQGQYVQQPGQYSAPPAYSPVYAPMPPAPPKSGHGKVLIVVVVVVVLIIAAIAAAVLFMAVANPFKNATEIFDGDTIEGEMSSSGADDLYKITLAPGDVLKATLSGAGGTDFDLYAYENEQFWDEYIITGSASEASSEDMNFVAWEDNFYIIDVYSYQGTGDYSLTVDIIDTVSLDDGDNSLADAYSIASGDPITAGLNEYYDQDDYYKITMNAGQILYAYLEVPVQVNTDFDLYIFDSSGNQLDISEAAYGNENASAYAQSAGVYYVNVWAYDGIGTYTLHVNVQAGTGTDTNNDIDSAVPALVGSPITNTINQYGDQDDYYSIDLTAGQTITVTMTGPSDADFDLYLYDDSPQIVASSEEATSSENIVFTAPSSGTYYVNPYAYSGFGTYSLDINAGSGGSVLNANAGSDRTVSADQTVTFDGSDSSGAITSYAWTFGDDSTGNGETTTHSYSSTGSYTVTLTVSDGTNTDSDTIGITVVAAGSMPNKYALVIGISDYQGDGDLSFCDEDADSWTAYLQAQGYTVHTLIDDQASTTEIMDEIAWLEGQEETGDYVAFVFSGHGSYSDRTRSSYICAWNVEEQDGFISDAQLGDAFANFDSQHIFFFFDSCYSGGMDSIAGSGRYVSQTAADDELGLDAPKFEHGMWVYWFLVYAIQDQGNADLTRAYDVAYPGAVSEAAAVGNPMHPEEEYTGSSFYL